MADTILDFERGLADFSNDKNMYKVILQSVADEGHDKLKAMVNAYETGDLSSYRIVVHGIASVSGSVGGAEFMRRGRLLENAAANSDTEYIRQNGEAFRADYERMIKEIIAYIG